MHVLFVLFRLSFMLEEARRGLNRNVPIEIAKKKVQSDFYYLGDLVMVMLVVSL